MGTESAPTTQVAERNPAVGPDTWAITGSVAVLLFLVFVSLWWDRFLGVSLDGWFQLYGEQMLDGKVPYRDFYLFAPPLHPLKSAAISAIFGSQWWVFRLVAVLERVFLLVVVLLWLKRSGVSPTAALAGSGLALVIFCGDIADPIFYYHQDSVLYAVLSGFLASVAVTCNSLPRFLLWSALAGFSASLAFLTKQTTGIGITLVILLLPALILMRTSGRRWVLLGMLATGLGWLPAPSALAIWLARNAAFQDYVDQVFIRGPSSKGPFFEVLLRPILLTFANPSLLFCALLAGLFLWTLALAGRASGKIEGKGGAVARPLSWSGIAMLSGLLLAAILGGSAIELRRPSARIPQIVLIYFTMLGSLVFFIAHAARWVTHSGRNYQESAQWLLCAVSLSNCYFLSLSWPAFEPMVVPGLAFLAAFYLTKFERESHRIGPVPLWSTYGAVAVAVFFAAVFKTSIPFQWGWFTEPPVKTATQASSLAQLEHLCLSHDTVRFIETISSHIHQHSHEGDKILVFPHMPIFYILANRSPCTFAYVHYWDVCPDHVARADAEKIRLGKERAKVLVIGALNPSEVLSNERCFRSGRPSGQRDLIRAMEELTESGDYELVDSVRAPGCMEVRVWSRIR